MPAVAETSARQKEDVMKKSLIAFFILAFSSTVWAEKPQPAAATPSAKQKVKKADPLDPATKAALKNPDFRKAMAEEVKAECNPTPKKAKKAPPKKAAPAKKVVTKKVHIRQNVSVGVTNPVPGPVGPAGPQGLAGANGKDGRDGKDGKDGKNGAMGVVGPRGPAGPGAKFVIMPTAFVTSSGVSALLSGRLILGLGRQVGFEIDAGAGLSPHRRFATSVSGAIVLRAGKWFAIGAGPIGWWDVGDWHGVKEQYLGCKAGVRFTPWIFVFSADALLGAMGRSPGLWKFAPGGLFSAGVRF